MVYAITSKFQFVYLRDSKVLKRMEQLDLDNVDSVNSHVVSMLIVQMQELTSFGSNKIIPVKP